MIINPAQRLGQILVAVIFFSLFCLGSAGPLLAGDTDQQCDALTMEEAADILGVPSAELRRGGSDLLVSPEEIRRNTYKTPPRSCWIRSVSNLLKSLHYNVYQYTDPEQARGAFVTMRDNFGTVASIKTIPLARGQAFRIDDSRFRRTIAWRKDLLLDILSPTDGTLQRRIMTLVLGRL